jgi:ABC-type transporter MlaC component
MTTREKMKEDFLNQFRCDATRAYAKRLYELHEQSIETNKGRASAAVLEVVDIYDEIPESEITALGIAIERKVTEAA